ncbi:MAG: hypothetical protein P9L92_15905 [Candidatus Electryonea clarkiae]|nr:hypothetical protein [Candidatus Electryonea clarkiae]MDP8285796.1 hypothetical protein [Candidatus Electryonea clarkiae]
MKPDTSYQSETDQENAEFIHEEMENGESSFDGTTSKTTWDKIRGTADRFVHRTIETAEDIALRGKIELEIASIRLRLRSLYAKIGEAVYRLQEGEERPDPLQEEEIQPLFQDVKLALADLTREKQKLVDLKKRERWTGES